MDNNYTIDSVSGLPVQKEPQMENQPVQNDEQPKKKSNPLKIILIVFGCLVGFLVVVAVVLYIVFAAVTSKLVCDSDEGGITLYYTKNQLFAYKATGIYSYDLSEQKKLYTDVGSEEYLTEFEDWFSENSSESGTCVRK